VFATLIHLKTNLTVGYSSRAKCWCLLITTMKKLSFQSFNVSSAITLVPKLSQLQKVPEWICLSLVNMVLECVFFVSYFGHGMCISLVSLVHQITNTTYTRYICNLIGGDLRINRTFTLTKMVYLIDWSWKCSTILLVVVCLTMKC
jgi:hypothetical protein